MEQKATGNVENGRTKHQHLSVQLRNKCRKAVDQVLPYIHRYWVAGSAHSTWKYNSQWCVKCLQFNLNRRIDFAGLIFKICLFFCILKKKNNNNSILRRWEECWNGVTSQKTSTVSSRWKLQDPGLQVGRPGSSKYKTASFCFSVLFHASGKMMT